MAFRSSVFWASQESNLKKHAAGIFVAVAYTVSRNRTLLTEILMEKVSR